MAIYLGIDEAGYGPMFGPLTVGCIGLRYEPTLADAAEGGSAEPDATENPLPGVGALPGAGTVDFWDKLSAAVCRTGNDKRRRLPVNDSKKLYSPKAKAGLLHLERSVLAFLSAGTPAHHVSGFVHDLGTLLDHLEEKTHRDHDLPDWYSPGHTEKSPLGPWQALPTSLTTNELMIDTNLLRSAMHDAGVSVALHRVATVFEPRFNRMVRATHSKAALSFTFVAQHLLAAWERFGTEDGGIIAAIDRQSGRQNYRELLALNLLKSPKRVCMN